MAKLAVAVAIAAVLASSGAVAAPNPVPVLGWKNAFAPYGSGWATPHPAAISNGGDPNGHAWSLRWSGWGKPAAVGRGLTWIFSPRGGYFAKPGKIEFRAYGVGRCTPGGPIAYLHLSARESTRPGGRYGHWFRWNGRRTICTGS